MNQNVWIRICLRSAYSSDRLDDHSLKIFTDQTCSPNTSFLIAGHSGGTPHIFVGTGGPHKEMALAHEFAHLLEYRYIRCRQDEERSPVRHEIMAWRIAKAFLKPELWDEQYARACLATYFIDYRVRIRWNRFKIIPY